MDDRLELRFSSRPDERSCKNVKSFQKNMHAIFDWGGSLMLVKRIHSRKIPAGATIFEKAGKKYARWIMASGKTQIQPLNRKGDRVVEESRCWYVRFRHPETGKWKEWKAYNDRQASQAMEIDILKKLERGEVGLIDPMTVHRKTAMDDHLAAFEVHLEDKGNTREHIDKTISRCRRIFGEIKARVVADITADGVDRSLANFRRGGMSLSTSNGYFRAMRTFCHWLVRTKRVGENPIAGLSCIRVTEADRKRRRRNLSDVEVQALLDATRQSKKTFMGLSGPDRAMLYIIAINTGLAVSSRGTYLDAVESLIRYFWCSPADLTEQQVNEYLIKFHRSGPARGTFKIRRAALRLFFCNTLGHDW